MLVYEEARLSLTEVGNTVAAAAAVVAGGGAVSTNCPLACRTACTGVWAPGVKTRRGQPEKERGGARMGQ